MNESRLGVRDLENHDRLTKQAAVHVANDEFVTAIPLLIEAVNICSDSAETWSSLGHALGNAGRPHEAAQCHQNAVTLQPQEPLFVGRLVNSLSRADLAALDQNMAKRAFQKHFTYAYARFPGIEAKISPVVQLKDWKFLNAAETFTLEADQAVHLEPGGTGYRDDYLAAATNVVEISDASVIAGWDYVVSSSGELLDGSGHQPVKIMNTWMPHIYCKQANLALHMWTRETAVIEEPTLFLSVPPDHNLGHWIVDFLPRLRALKFIASRGTQPPKIAVTSSLPRRHREFLTRFGVDSADILDLELGKRYRFKSLWVVEQGHRNTPQRGRIEFLRQQMFSPPENAALSGPRRIFLERSQSPRGRNIANQPEVNVVLRELGFESVKLRDHSVAEQQSLLNGTEIVIATFGTDLASMFHFAPKTALIILVQDDVDESKMEGDVRGNERYCAIIGMRPDRLICKSVSNTAGQKVLRKKELFYRDMTVDCDLLRASVARVLAKS